MHSDECPRRLGAPAPGLPASPTRCVPRVPQQWGPTGAGGCAQGMLKRCSWSGAEGPSRGGGERRGRCACSFPSRCNKLLPSPWPKTTRGRSPTVPEATSLHADPVTKIKVLAGCALQQLWGESVPCLFQRPELPPCLPEAVLHLQHQQCEPCLLSTSTPTLPSEQSRVILSFQGP